MRLFILPHTLAGIALLCAMVFMPIWQVAGTVSTTRVAGVWTTQSKGTKYHVKYFDPTSGKFKETGIGRAEYERLAKLLPASVRPALTPVEPDPAAPPAATVTVKTLKVGAYGYTDVIDTGSSGWKTVGLLWLFGLFWNAIILSFAFAIYVQPVRTKRLRREGEASPGRIAGKTTERGSKGRTRYVLKYVFTPSGRRHVRPRSGEEVTATQEVTQAEWDAAAEDDAVWVLHWPGRSKPSVLWEMGTGCAF